MLKEKMKVTQENIEMYKELYDARENLTTEDITKVCKRMVIILGLGVGFSCLFPPSIFLFFIATTLATTYGVAVKSVNDIFDRKERKLMLKYSDLDVSMDNQELLRQIEFVEQHNRKEDDKEKPVELVSSCYKPTGVYGSTDERNKVLVKKI